MIQGRIDFASRERVEGWIHSSHIPLAGARLYAYVDDHCAGDGVVNVQRSDVAAAGFGDGLAGFRFAIHLEPQHDPRILDIRLEGGNVILRQEGTTLVPREETGADRRRAGRDPRALAWMRAREWLTQPQYDAQVRLGRLGVHRHRLGLSAAERGAPDCAERVAALARELIEVQLFDQIALEVRSSLGAEDHQQLRRGVRSEFPAAPPVIGLWAAHEGVVRVVEGSHLRAQADAAEGGVDHDFGDNHLLLVNLDCRIAFPTGSGATDLSVFVPRPAPLPALRSTTA